MFDFGAMTSNLGRGGFHEGPGRSDHRRGEAQGFHGAQDNKGPAERPRECDQSGESRCRTGKFGNVTRPVSPPGDAQGRGCQSTDGLLGDFLQTVVERPSKMASWLADTKRVLPVPRDRDSPRGSLAAFKEVVRDGHALEKTRATTTFCARFAQRPRSTDHVTRDRHNQTVRKRDDFGT